MGYGRLAAVVEGGEALTVETGQPSMGEFNNADVAGIGRLGHAAMLTDGGNART